MEGIVNNTTWNSTIGDGGMQIETPEKSVWKYEISDEDKNDIKEHDDPDRFFVELNGNEPYLVEDDKKQLKGNVNPFSDLDHLNRCRVACVCISKNTLSNGQGNRPSIKSKPTGFFQRRKIL